MKGKNFFIIILILAIGAVLSFGILNMDIASLKGFSSDSHSEAGHDEGRDEDHGDHDDGETARGAHGGWLFSEDDLRVEVKIFETGVPPQFRVYLADSSNRAIDLNAVKLIIKLHRLDRIDEIHFKPSGDYLLGDKIVSEPHSFRVQVHAQWKGKKYQWEISQIEARAELSEESVKNAGIIVSPVGPAQLNNTLKLTGEIGLNEEKLVHIVPRLDGIAKRVFKDLGDKVAKGEIMALLDSRELADAKTNYLAALKQSKLALADLKRETLLFKNTSIMLDLLSQEKNLEIIYAELKGLQIGESRQLLIPAYGKLNLAKSVYLREKGLFGKGISSQSEYLAAVEDFKSAEARYAALREKISYDGQWAVRQKQRNSEMETLKLQTARQQLFTLGLGRIEVESLTGQDGSLYTQYELRAPVSGVVIQKHLTTGEAVKGDDAIFLLADLSDVWVNIAIPSKDLKFVELGQKVIVRDENLEMEAIGKMTYLSSIIDEKTRTITGRVVIPNRQGRWRPGGFVTVELIFEERRVPLAVTAESIQTIRDWSVVFVKYGNFFEARPLELGESDGRWIEVLDGLKRGEQYVSQNSFSVKAEIEKSSATHSH